MEANTVPEGQENETVQENVESALEAAPEQAGPVEEPSDASEELSGAEVAEQLFIVEAPTAAEDARGQLRALIEAVVYVTDEPLSAQQIAAALQRPPEIVKELLDELVAEYSRPDRGLTVREVAGGYKMGTRPEHHEAIRAFVRNLKPPLKLSLPALETLAVIAYKQPITAPEILDIRGVQGAGVLKTLLDRRLIATAGRKNVIGKPILYKTTKEFLVQFGLKDVSELPTLKEFEELGRLALSDSETESGQPGPPVVEPEPQPDGDPRPPDEPLDDPEPHEPGVQDPQNEPPEGDPPSDSPPEKTAGNASEPG